MLSQEQTSTVPRSDSTASSYKDLDDDEANGINRQRLDPDEARTHFLPARVDARDVDFSDRIDGHRKSYRASSRRRRKGALADQELGDFSDEDGGESLQRKLARIRREVEELKTDVEKRRLNGENRPEEENQPPDDDIDEEGLELLSHALKSIDMLDAKSGSSAESRLVRRLAVPVKPESLSLASGASDPSQQSQDKSTYTVTYAPEYQANHALAKAADFDARLTLLETILGLDSLPLPTQEKSSTKAVLPTLENLERQISTLSSSSGSTLDSMGKRVRQLTQDAEKLDEARKSAKVSYESLKASKDEAIASEVVTGESMGSIEDPEQTSKINALYGTLATIESLAPLLPSVLDRLRSLRLIHTDAANASQSLANVEKKQAEMAEDIKSWREGLEKVEAVMKDGESRMSGNMKVVEGWVKELEERMQKLSAV